VKLAALKRLIDEWKSVEGSSHRWSNLKVRKLIDELLATLEASERAYDEIAQRCDPAGETQERREAQERADALLLKLNEAESRLRQICYDFGFAHVSSCRRQRYDTRATVWDVAGCSRCRGEQALEDLRVAFEAEERSHDIPRTTKRHH
jgi:hypothetical protein